MYQPFPDDFETLQGKLRFCADRCGPSFCAEQAGHDVHERDSSLAEFADLVAGHHDPHAIPYLIALAEIDATAAVRVRRALRQLGRRSSPSRSRCPKGQGSRRDPEQRSPVSRPRRRTLVAGKWWADNLAGEVSGRRGGDRHSRSATSQLVFAWHELDDAAKKRAAVQQQETEMADVADTPAEDSASR